MRETKRQRLAPAMADSVFVAEGVRIFGDVVIAKNASIWFNAVLRGDEGRISVGENTNIQDGVVVHSDMGEPVVIGDRVTVGHGAVIRSCRIGNDVMIGMNVTVMTHAQIGEKSVVGANTLIPYRKTFPPRSLIMGVPGRAIREVTDDEIAFNQKAIDLYIDLVRRYTSGEIGSMR